MALSASGSWQPATGATGRGAGNARLAFTLAALLAAAAPAWAQDEERLFQYIEFWAADNLTHDTNVLRLSKRIDPSSVGARKLGDTINTLHLGANADIPVSLQRLQASFDWFNTRYRFFRNFDFIGHVARMNWQWVANPGLTGTAGFSETRALSSFANIQTGAPDLVTTQQAWITGAWMLTPRWRANAGYAHSRNQHDGPLRQVNDIDSETYDAGISYVTPLDNSVGMVARQETGHNPHPALVAGVPFENKYRHTGIGAAVAWNPGAHSRLDARAEWVKRDYDQFTQRNFSGAMLRALFTWTPSAKLTLASSIYRDVGPAEDVTTSFVLMTGGYIRPRWTVTDKITVQGNLEYDTWDFRGDPLTGGNFTHHVKMAGASVAYHPTVRTLIQAGVNREVRTSTLPLGEYEVTVSFIEGRIGF